MLFWIIAGVVAVLLFALAWWSSGRSKGGGLTGWGKSAKHQARHYEAYPHRPPFDNNNFSGGIS